MITEEPPPEESGKRELYTFEAPWLIYAINWSHRTDKPFRLACGSFLEDYINRVQVVSLNTEKDSLQMSGEFDHPYPPTKIMWLPEKVPNSPDLLGTSGDMMRLWEVKPEGGIALKCALNNNKNSDFCAPLTSFDWNQADPDMIGTASIDTTCTIWSVSQQRVKTQLIAHDKEVFDIAFARGTDVFASVGADGSVRMFDLRSLEHSTIIYESPDLVPLLRVAWNKQDPNYLATFMMDSKMVVVLDIRVPSLPATELQGHQAAVNSLTWAPHSSCHVCTGGEDRAALIWDISPLPKRIEYPILQFEAEGGIDQLAWSTLQPDWIAAAVGTRLQALRV